MMENPSMILLRDDQVHSLFFVVLPFIGLNETVLQNIAAIVYQCIRYQENDHENVLRLRKLPMLRLRKLLNC